MGHRTLLALLVLPLCTLLVGCTAEVPPNETTESSDALSDRDALYYQKALSLSDDAPRVAFSFQVKKWGILPADIIYSLFNVSAPTSEVAAQRDELSRGTQINVGTMTITRPNGDTRTMSLDALPYDATGSGLRVFLDGQDELRSTWARDGEYQVTIDKTPGFFSSVSMTFNATWQPFQP